MVVTGGGLVYLLLFPLLFLVSVSLVGRSWVVARGGFVWVLASKGLYPLGLVFCVDPCWLFSITIILLWFVCLSVIPRACSDLN